ncbi:MAG: dimethyl sulfoxide reductase anchor subunit [Proteobacteria bacterium]|nr:dimethyl sulfoxide reductase anchor subunit [Pseudomonadota bacterium]
MHPAYSVIFFTTAAGAGYGLLVWLVLFGILGLVPQRGWFVIIGFGLAFALITAGLLASSAHLGRPERAWRAFSQWRTSWLSREGVMAVLTYVPAGLLALSWTILEATGGLVALLALASIVCALLTLFTTGMIYASLRPIRQWHQPLTAPIYVVLGLASGAVLLALLQHIFGVAAAWAAWFVVAFLAIAAALKWVYWRTIDQVRRTYTIEAATGLGHIGKVRHLEPPHTQPNFIMREMGYRVGRKHAARLRLLAWLFGFAVPIAASLSTLLPGTFVPLIGAAVAALSMALGLLIERWLFFAQAEHVSMLYYGAEAA